MATETCGVLVVVRSGSNDGPPVGACAVTCEFEGGRITGEGGPSRPVGDYWCFPLPQHVTVFLTVTCDGFLPYERQPYEFGSGNQDVPIALTPVVVAQKPPRVSGQELLKIHGDFGCVRDGQNRSMFSPFLLTLMDEGRDDEVNDWFDRWRARKYTHIVLTPCYSYTGSPIAPRSFSPERFAELVERVLSTPAHDGFGFRPIIMMSDVPSDPIRERATALLPVRDHVIAIPAWEPIPTTDWTSRQVSDVLLLLHGLGFPTIGLHLQPGRCSMSSHPLEPDDPWQGNEAACWKSHGGEFVSVFLYQTEHGFTSAGGPDWANRWRDLVPRMGNGMNGWRVMPICLFETVLYDAYRLHCDETRARSLAAEAREIARKEFGVAVTYGNGGPAD